MGVLSYSVVISSAMSRSCLPACVDAVLAQTAAPREVVVVGPSGAPRPSDLPAQVAFATSAPSSNGQRNEGARHVSADLVLFVDDDNLLAPDFAEQLLEAWHSAPVEVAGMAGVIVNDPQITGLSNVAYFMLGLGCTAFRARSSRLRRSGHVLSVYQPDGSTPARFLHGCCVAYHRSKFVGELFDETFDGHVSGGDLDLAARMRRHGSLFQVPNAPSIAIEVPSTMPADEYRRARRFGETLAFYRWKHRGSGWPGTAAWEYANLGQVLLLIVRAVRSRTSQPLRGYLAGLFLAHRHIIFGRCRRWDPSPR